MEVAARSGRHPPPVRCVLPETCVTLCIPLRAALRPDADMLHGDLQDDDCVLGTTTRGFELAAPVTLGLDDRRRHMHLLGKTGTGKTTLLRTLIYDDLAAGRNFAVLDPLGGLAEAVIDAVPKSRNDETIYFDPTTSNIRSDSTRLTAWRPTCGISLPTMC